MIIKNIKISSQNVWKNNLIINMILKTRFEFDIVFIQKLSWSSIHAILSSKSRDSKKLVDVPNHPNWLVSVNSSSNIHDYLRVITYVNIRLSSFWFSLYKDVINHRDILLIFFFINNNIFFLINIYSNSLQSALKCLKDTKVDIPNVLIMTGDFNIRNSFWDPLYLYHSIYSNLLIDIIDSLLLELLYPTNLVPTRYLDSDRSSNLVIDPMFLRYGSKELDNHSIYLE